MLKRAATVLLLSSAGITMARAKEAEIPSQARPAVNCVYHIVISNSAVRSADIYAVDSFRFAIEYVLRDKTGRAAISDILLTSLPGVTYSGMSPPDQSEMAKTAGMDFLSGISEGLNAECHVSPAFDNLLPPPKSRSEWRKVKLPISP